MKFLPYLLKHLRKNWFRTALTVAAMALCIFLFCTLQSVLAAINGQLEATSAKRLVSRHAVSLVFNLPLVYGPRIQAVPGVERVSTAAWFGGSLPAKKEEKKADESTTTDFSNFFMNIAVEPEPFFAMYPEYGIPPEQFQAFQQDLRGAVVGRKLADRFGWKLGDTFYLESFIPPYRKPDGPFEFVVRAIYDNADPVKYPSADLTQMFFQFKYLYEATGRSVGAGYFFVEIQDPEQAATVSRGIDALFENSDAQTRTETEKAFAASFVAMAGNLSLLLNGIGIAVTFTILLVVANTMSIAVRERRTEIAVLKTLGFRSGQVMGLVVAESLLIALLGAAVGIGGARGLMWVLSGVPAIKDTLASFGLSGLGLKPLVALLGLGVALFLGLAAGFVPALSAYRAKITDMLRTA